MAKVDVISQLDGNEFPTLPLYTEGVPAGVSFFPSDTHAEWLDLGSLLVRHPKNTYLVKVMGDSMTGAGILDGDMLVVDQALQAEDGKIVIASLNGELTVKRLRHRNGTCSLTAEHPDYSPIELTEDMDARILGVVTTIIHKV